MEFAKERDMRQVVTDWLVSQGYLVGYEIMLSGYCDIVAGRFGERPSPGRVPPLLYTVAVELKLSRIAEVISQARLAAYSVNESWVAMPYNICFKMRTRTRIKFQDAEVGLLSVRPEIVTVCISPKIYSTSPCGDHLYLKQRLWRQCRKQYINTERKE